MSLTIKTQSKNIITSLSAGIVVLEKDSLSSSDVYHNADIALYRAKNEGRGRFVIFNKTMSLDIDARNKINQYVVNEIENDEILISIYMGKGKIFQKESRFIKIRPDFMERYPASANFVDPSLRMEIEKNIINKVLKSIKKTDIHVIFEVSADFLKNNDAVFELINTMDKNESFAGKVMISFPCNIIKDRNSEKIMNAIIKLKKANVLPVMHCKDPTALSMKMVSEYALSFISVSGKNLDESSDEMIHKIASAFNAGVIIEDASEETSHRNQYDNHVVIWDKKTIKKLNQD